MTKIVINNCYGGFSLSPKAIKRYLELKGKECYFFKLDISLDEYTPLTLEQAEEKSLFFTAFTVPNPKEILPKEKNNEEDIKKFNEIYNKIKISQYDIKRDDPHLIKVVEELGEKANGRFANLKVVEIPDDVEWEIDEYDGEEIIHEKHRSWG